MTRVAEMSTGNFSKFANLNMQKCKNDNILFWLIKQVTSRRLAARLRGKVHRYKQNVLNERDMFVLFILMWTGQNQQNQQNQRHQLLICVKLPISEFSFCLFSGNSVRLNSLRLV